MKPQATHAIRLAHDASVARAQLKRALKAGAEYLPVVLLTPPAHALRMPIVQLLEAAPGIGKGRANRVLARHGLTSLDLVEDVDQGTRGAIVSFICSEYHNTWRRWGQQQRERAAA